MTAYQLHLAIFYLVTGTSSLLFAALVFVIMTPVQAWRPLWRSVISGVLVMAGLIIPLLVWETSWGWMAGLGGIAGCCLALLLLRSSRLPVVWLLLCALILVTIPTGTILAGRYCQEIETDRASTTLTATVEAIGANRDALSSVVARLAQDPTVLLPTPSWMTSTARTNQLQLSIITDAKGIIVAATPNAQSWNGSLADYMAWLPGLEVQDTFSGLARIRDTGLFLVAGHTIVSGDGSPAGWLLIGRRIDSEYLSSLSPGNRNLALADNRGILALHAPVTTDGVLLGSADTIGYVQEHLGTDFRQPVIAAGSSQVLIGKTIATLGGEAPVSLLTTVPLSLSRNCLR
ncbi:MAG: CHASE4 domain-containing protein [bacterium]